MKPLTIHDGLLGMLAMWSANRDNGHCGDKAWADPTCSGVIQEDFAFTNIFSYFNHGGAGNISPQAVVTSPLNGDLFDPGDTVLLSADAEDPDGTVMQVAFLVDGVSLGADQDAPYTLSWTDVPEGTHMIIAVATDDQGAVGHAASIQITVGGGGALSTWDSSKIYTAGDEVCHKGKAWQAKWWTTGEEPGTTGQWGCGKN